MIRISARLPSLASEDRFTESLFNAVKGQVCGVSVQCNGRTEYLFNAVRGQACGASIQFIVEKGQLTESLINRHVASLFGAAESTSLEFSTSMHPGFTTA